MWCCTSTSYKPHGVRWKDTLPLPSTFSFTLTMSHFSTVHQFFNPDIHRVTCVVRIPVYRNHNYLSATSKCLLQVPVTLKKTGRCSCPSAEHREGMHRNIQHASYETSVGYHFLSAFALNRPTTHGGKSSGGK